MKIGQNKQPAKDRVIGDVIAETIKNNKQLGLTNDPQWHKAYGHYDWRNHVPEIVQKMWSAMTVESRVITYLVADSEARKEDWKD